MAPEYLNSNVVNFLVYRYLEEAGTFSSASIDRSNKQMLIASKGTTRRLIASVEAGLEMRIPKKLFHLRRA